MPVVRWTFTDPTLGETWTVPINPNDGGTPALAKNIHTAARTAPGAGHVIQEGEDQPGEMTFSGVILTQDHLETFQDWFDRRVVLIMTDDLNREFSIYFKSFSATRKWSHQYPWRHDYQVSAMVVDQ